jgi:hypothetical protein
VPVEVNVDALTVDCRRSSCPGSGGGSRRLAGHGRLAEAGLESMENSRVTGAAAAGNAQDGWWHSDLTTIRTGPDPRRLRDQFKRFGLQ